jgi:hypothetical protein
MARVRAEIPGVSRQPKSTNSHIAYGADEVAADTASCVAAACHSCIFGRLRSG